MKIRVTMKDQDSLIDAIDDAVKAELDAIKELNEDDREALRRRRRDMAARVAFKWFKWGEYLTVEIDTETQTISVALAT